MAGPSRGNKAAVFATAILVSMFPWPQPVEGFFSYRAALPNGASNGGKMGHGGEARSSFGSDFGQQGRKWTRSLCEMDSDGDGVSNGGELGDPCCKWTRGATPEFTSGLSHPGRSSSKTSSHQECVEEPPPPPKASTPTISLTNLISGAQNSPRRVSIVTTTDQASLCFRKDGSSPGCSSSGSCATGSTSYSSPLEVTTQGTHTIKALACKAGFTESEHSQTSFNVNTFTVEFDAGSVTDTTVDSRYGVGSKVLTMVANPSDATICYTQDGSTPGVNAATCTCNSNSFTYSSSIQVALTTTYKFMACAPYHSNSNVGTHSVTVHPVASITAISVDGSGPYKDEAADITIEGSGFGTGDKIAVFRGVDTCGSLSSVFQSSTTVTSITATRLVARTNSSTGLFGEYTICYCQKLRTGSCNSEHEYNLSPPSKLKWKGVAGVSQTIAPTEGESSTIVVTGHGLTSDYQWKLIEYPNTCNSATDLSNYTEDSLVSEAYSVSPDQTSISKLVEISVAGRFYVCLCDESRGSSGCSSHDRFNIEATGLVEWFSSSAARLEYVHAATRNAGIGVDVAVQGKDFNPSEDKLILIPQDEICGTGDVSNTIFASNSLINANGISPNASDSNATYMIVNNISASVGGTYRVCMCDYDATNSPCNNKNHYKTEASSQRKFVSWVTVALAQDVQYEPSPNNPGTLTMHGQHLSVGDDTLAIFTGNVACSNANGIPRYTFDPADCAGDGAGTTKLLCHFGSSGVTLQPGTYTACFCDKSKTGHCSSPEMFSNQPQASHTFVVPSLVASGAKMWWEKDSALNVWKTHLQVNVTNFQPNLDRLRLQKSEICGVDRNDDVLIPRSLCNGTQSNEDKVVCLNVQVPAGDWRVCLCDASKNVCDGASNFSVTASNKLSVPQLSPISAEASNSWLVAGTTMLEHVSVRGTNFDPEHDRLGLVRITRNNMASPCDGTQMLEKSDIRCNIAKGGWGVTNVFCGPVSPVQTPGAYALCMCDENSVIPTTPCASSTTRYKTLIPAVNLTYVAAASVTSIKLILGKAEAGLRALYEFSGTNMDPTLDRLVAIQHTDTCGSNSSTVIGISPGGITEWSQLKCDAGPDFVKVDSTRLRQLDWSSSSSGEAWSSSTSGGEWTSSDNGNVWSERAKAREVLQCPIVLPEGKAKFCLCDYSVHGSCSKLEHFAVEPDGGMIVSTGPGNVLLPTGFDSDPNSFKIMKTVDGKDRLGMAWKFEEDWLYVGARAETNGYISVAFGKTLKMEGADAVIGWSNEAGTGHVKAFKLRASDHLDPGGEISSTEKRSSFLNSTSLRREGKYITITFRRKIGGGGSARRSLLSADDDVHVSNADVETKILWAVSQTGLSGDRLGAHSPNDRGAVSINLASGSVTEVSLIAQWYSLYILLGGLALTAMSGLSLLHLTTLRKSSLGRNCLQTRLGGRKLCKNRCGLPTLIFNDLNPVNWLLNLSIGEFMAFVVVVCASSAAYIVDTQSTSAYLSSLRSTGKLVGLFGVLTVLSITRSFSVFFLLFGIPFERAVKWHRGLAKLFVLLTFVHFLCHAVPQGLSATFSLQAFGGAEAIPLYGTLSFIAELIIIITSIEAIRREYFEVFYFLHYACFLSLMIFSLLHVQKFKSPSQLAFVFSMGAAILLWIIDIVMRFTCAAPQVQSCVAKEVYGVTKLTVALSKSPSIGPGDYFFLTVPDVSLSQSHPFSVSSQSNSNEITFHIKQMGDNSSFTTRLGNLVKQRAGRGQTSLKNVSLSGPYGRLSVNLEDYKELWLVAGGIGITPMISTALHIASKLHNGGISGYPNLKKVHLLWSVRATDQLLWFSDELNQLSNKNSIGESMFQLHLYVTRYSKVERRDSINVAYNVESGVEMTQVATNSNPMHSQEKIPFEFNRDKRPSYAILFEKSAHKDANVAVMACGPPALVSNVETCAFAKGFHFHKETFLL